MTESELKQLYYMNRETERLTKDLNEMKSRSSCKSPIVSGMPRNTKAKDVGDYVAELADLEEIISLNLLRIQRERARLERYIGSVEDSEIRLIMRLRHINGMTWEDIAAELVVIDDRGNIVRSQNRTTISKKYYKYLENSHISH